MSIISTQFLQSAYDDAVRKFGNDLTSDAKKVAFVNSTAHLVDVQTIVNKALESYDGTSGNRPHQTAKKWVRKVANSIEFYGKVLYVISQHHPEYVALGWGAMKFFLRAITNHENITNTLANALSDIGDMLPRVELASTLYPTARMKSAISNLYAYLLRFFIRARDWYEEGTWKRIVHSITRPAELRYADLLAQIGQISKRISLLSRSAEQAETRAIHQKIDSIQAMAQTTSQSTDAMRATIYELQATVVYLQFSQIMSSISQVSIWEPMKTYRYLRSLQRRRGTQSSQFSTNQFWTSPKLQAWSTSAASSLIIIKGNVQSRFKLRDFCVDVSTQLQSTGVPFLFAMRNPAGLQTSANISMVDLLKYLSHQALQLRRSHNDVQTTERKMALDCARFRTPVSEKDWFQILESILAGIAGSLYIIVELEILDRLLAPPESGFSLLAGFVDFFASLSQRGLSNRIKVMFVT
ncbi:hypothetical protein B0H67DRAFT_482926 [Lasiosphaeris hirsuta]|uniref:DUF7708 domain-containing protein n=1 Tax=Lasiosphaeris hirsuta TaxID=260670 RepID=A0AA40E4V3_9PEZI|nr:hypothetical protein B0H67DRAFT_482926 [Lasiosphaeris hirsuta]